MKPLWALALALVLLASAIVPFLNIAEAASPPGFSDATVASGLDLPTAMEFSPDGRLFVSEKNGDLRVIKNGALLTQPFVSIPVNSAGERGLLGIAFDPNFSSNGYIYVYYTTSTEPVHNRVSRFTADPASPDRALAGSEVQILNLEPLNTESHNGGAIEFGPDGMLYVSTGDNYFPYYSQSLTSRFGKILRINSDGSIPADNPFYNVQGAYKEIWALGLRNPFTFQFSPDGSKMHIADVGQFDWEEVNIGLRGANYGWPTCEGMCSDPNFLDPLYTYPHPTDGTGASITGGPFYEVGQFPPEYEGSYFFGDYVQGFISRLTPTNQVETFLTGIGTPVAIEVGPDGSLYYLTIFPGVVHKVTFGTPGNSFPAAVANANPLSGLPPLDVVFSGSTSIDPDGDALTYSWNFGDGSPAASGVSAAHTYGTAGSYTATLTVDDGRGGSDTDTIEISVGNPPVGTINTPAVGTTYDAGNTILFGGSAADAEDGVLPASAFEWTVMFHHNTHTHPFQEYSGVTGGSFTIPTVGETADDVWYRITLTVTDSVGLTHTSTRDVLPNKSEITLASSVPGLSVLLDGQPRTTPYSFTGVVGITRTLEAPESQNLAGTLYDYESWSDSGTRMHNISTPVDDTVFTAAFVESGAAPERTLTIHAVDFSGNPLSMYTTVSLDGAIIQTGFTPFIFTGTEGVTYTVGVQDFGSATFDHWENGSTARARTLTLNINTELTAFYRTSDAPPPNSYNLTVRSADLSGDPITGYYTVISENGSVVQTGYTPLIYLGQPSHTYTVTVSDFGTATFDHWDDGSTTRTRSVELGTSLILTAYFSTEPAPPPPPPDPVLTVASVDSLGAVLTGYYTVISENGSVVQTGFTPVSFTGKQGITYDIEVQDYGSFAFDHWENGNTTRTRMVTLDADVTITAHYADISDSIAPTVSASPLGGTYTSSQSVTLSASEPATIYYTIDGSTPTTSSSVYSAPIDISATSTLKFFAVDSAGNAGAVITELYTIESTVFPVTHMSDTTATYGLATHSAQQAQAEFVSPTSQLAGKSIDEITLKLRKTGSPTGQAQIGVFNADLSAKKLFGTITASTIASTYTDYTFSLPNNELYTIAANDRIGIKYSEGNTGNFVAVMLDQDPSDPFDGTNTYRQVYTTSWLSSTPNDMYMILKQTHGSTDIIPPTVTAFPAGGEYTVEQSVTLTADEPATIYYTLDGTTPTTSSPVYSSLISVSSTTTLKFLAIDTADNIGAEGTEVYTIQPVSFPVMHMSDTTATYGLATHSAQQSHVEFVSPTSELIGKSIDQITMKLRKTGAPASTFEIGVFNADLTVKKSFGTMSASAVASTYTDYTFSLAGGELYTIQAGDRIGIKYSEGNTSNFVAAMIDRDAADPFNGSDTYRQLYTTLWFNYPSDDIYMILLQSHA